MKVFLFVVLSVLPFISCVTETDLDGNPVPFFSNIHVAEVPIFDASQLAGNEKSIKLVSSLVSEPTNPNLLSEVVFSTYETKDSVDAKARYGDKGYLYKISLAGERLTRDKNAAHATRSLLMIEALDRTNTSATYSFPRMIALPFEIPGDRFLPQNYFIVLGRQEPRFLQQEVSAYDYFADRSRRIEIRNTQGEVAGFLDSSGVHLEKLADSAASERVLGVLLLCAAVREELFFETVASQNAGH